MERQGDIRLSGVSGNCEKCDAYIESLSRHDYSVCECGHAMLDGGNVDGYHRSRGIDPTTLMTWDWTDALGRRWCVTDMETAHLRNIIKDGYSLGPAMRKEAVRRGLL